MIKAAAIVIQCIIAGVSLGIIAAIIWLTIQTSQGFNPFQ